MWYVCTALSSVRLRGSWHTTNSMSSYGPHTHNLNARNQDAQNSHPYKNQNVRGVLWHISPPFYIILIFLTTFEKILRLSKNFCMYNTRGLKHAKQSLTNNSHGSCILDDGPCMAKTCLICNKTWNRRCFCRIHEAALKTVLCISHDFQEC